jgi:hypothetical protein
MGQIGFRFGLLCGITFLSFGFQAKGQSDNLLRRFRIEGPEGWKTVESADEFPGTIKLTHKMHIYIGGELTKTEEKTALIRRKPGYFFFESSKAGIRLALGKNPHYSFQISRGETKKQWRLHEVLTKSHPEFAKISLDLVQYLKPNSFGFVRGLGSVSDIVKGRQFKAVSAAPLEGALIQINFETAIPIPKHEIPVKGFMVFDPKCYWTLQSATYEVAGACIFSQRKYSEEKILRGYCPCQLWESTTKVPKENTEIKRQNSYEIIDSSVPADHFFKLKHYGLPEPEGVRWESSNSCFLWFILIGVICVGLGITIRHRYRKAKELT